MVTCVLFIDSLPGQRMDLAVVPRVGECTTMYILGEQYRLESTYIEHNLIPDDNEPGKVNQEVWIRMRASL